MIRKILATSLVFIITWTTTWMAAPAAFAQESPGSQPNEASATQRFDYLANLLTELRSQIDRSQFDLESLLESVDYDADRIVSFVRQEIDYEPYDGLLRGARGTLMSRAGNSLDQSVLLATLLKMSGYEARIAYSSLSLAKARILLAQIRPNREGPTPFKDEEAVQRLITAAVEESGQSAAIDATLLADQIPYDDSLASQISLDREGVAKVSEDIISHLAANEIIFDPDLAGGDYVEEARQYYWVEIRTSPSSDWRDCQPVFSDPSKQFDDLVTEETLAETIPSNLQFQLSIDLEIEQRLGGKTSRRPVMSTWRKPVANLLGEPISIANIPDGLLRLIQDLDLADAISDSRFFIPLLNGAPAPGAQAFDRNGNTVPLDTLALGAAEYFATLSDKAGSATSALGALGGSNAKKEIDGGSMSLAAVWVTYSIEAPDGKVSKYQRNLLNPSILLGTAAPTDPEGLTSDLLLATEYSMMVAAGRYPLAFTIDVALERLQQSLNVFQAILPHTSEEPEEFLKLASGHLKDLDSTWNAQLSLFQLFDDWPDDDKSVRTFRHRPNLLVHKSMPQTSGPARTAVDVVTNAKRALKLEDNGSTRPSPEQLLKTGIWESLTEGSLPSARNVDRLNAARRLIAERESGNNFTIFEPNDEEKLVSANLSDSARVNIEQDLDNGFVVLLSGTFSEADVGREVWWRVHPGTGETLALFQDGSGVDIGGYLIVIGVAAVFFLGSSWAQWQTCKETDSFNVCTACAGLTGAIGLFAVAAAIIDYATRKDYSAAAGLTLLFIAAAKEAGCSVWFYETQ